MFNQIFIFYFVSPITFTMALLTNDNKPKVSAPRLKLEERLTSMKLKSKKYPTYTAWAIFDYIFIRTYNNYYKLHVWNNADHNDRFQRDYSTINYNAVKSAFIFLLMEPYDEYSIRRN